MAKLTVIGGKGSTEELSDLTKKTFDAFVHANGIKIKREFGKPTIYAFNSKEYKQNDLLGIIEFTGFSDGYHGSPRKYAGPQGSAKTGPKTVNLQVFLKKQQIYERHSKRAVELPQQKYELQYLLGSNYRKN